MKCGGKELREVFFSTLKISAGTFGGGYVIVPMLRKRFVDELGWIDEGEMLDMVSVAQSSPGAIAVNASLMVGYRIGGVLGALTAALGTVIPPLVIISVISLFYKWFRDDPYVAAVMRGMLSGVAAVICSAVLDLGRAALKTRRLFSALVMAAVFIAVYVFKVNVIFIIVSCAFAGLAAGWIYAKLGKEPARGKDGK